mmetsp:Transcript_10915/g.16711  ORF Transcript_10915/g.16711 Transcript_10915/m.16711 type:complete len:85 (-) Transcript_10915:519-773(-)
MLFRLPKGSLLRQPCLAATLTKRWAPTSRARILYGGSREKYVQLVVLKKYDQKNENVTNFSPMRLKIRWALDRTTPDNQQKFKI